jgi:hypothetical protein
MGVTLPHRAVHAGVLVVTLLAPIRVYADWFVTPFMGVKFGGSTSIVDLEQAADRTKLTIGGSLSRIGDGLFGFEVEGAYIPGYFERDTVDPKDDLVTSSSVLDLSGNAIIALPPNLTGGGLRPYLTAGFGLMHAEGVDIQAFFRIRRTMPAITLGGGATGLLTNRVGVRFDLRYLRSVAQQDEFQISVGRQLSYWRGTIGIGVKY